MKRRHPILIRAASSLAERYEQIARSEQQTYSIDSRDFADAIEEYMKVMRKLTMAIERGYRLAAERLTAQTRLAAERLEYWTGTRHGNHNLHRRTHARPGLGELQRELLSLTDEFDLVEFNRGDGRVSVTTNAIVLEGVALGRFRIDLTLCEMRGENCQAWYAIHALDPNPPSANEDVTHPHVDAQRLCAGEAVTPIDNALRDGRLTDFFMLVRCVLETYNGDSAYVRLEEWDGRRCSDCEYIADSDSFYICETCHRELCEECVGVCKECRMSFCSGCLSTSEVSDRRYCNECMTRCSGCDGLSGKKELNEDRLCSDCQENQLEEEHDHDPTTNTQEPTGDAAQGPQRPHSEPRCCLTSSDSEEEDSAQVNHHQNEGADADLLPAGLAQAPIALPRR